MNTARKGNGKEKATERLLEEDGWLVGSRRHIGGPGDLLAVARAYNDGMHERVRVIEVKATLRPYSHFGPKDREALLRFAEENYAEAELAWWPPGSKTCQFIPSSDWP